MDNFIIGTGEDDQGEEAKRFKYFSRFPMNGEGMPHISRVVLFVGTRPEIIKIAPVYHALKSVGIEPLVIHGGQQESITYPLYEFFGMRPAISLLIARADSGLAKLTEQLLSRVSETLRVFAPDLVLIPGDTTVAFVGALASFYLHLPVGHVGAGIRSGNNASPFPEEINRQLIARVSTWHFAPSPLAAANLIAEGINRKSIYVTGNTGVDAITWAMKRVKSETTINEIPGRRLLIVTAHHKENWGNGIKNLAKAILILLKRHPDLQVVWPLYPNPEIRVQIRTIVEAENQALRRRVRLVNLLSYQHMLRTLARAWLVITDSAGIQEEAVCAHVPVLIIRRQTERPEIIECGAGRLVGNTIKEILASVEYLYQCPRARSTMIIHENPFGDGRAAQRIVSCLASQRAQFKVAEKTN